MKGVNMFDIKGDALIILEDFIKYSELYPNEMAAVMWYDVDGFKSSVELLKKQMENKNE
jgi:hypothetical protein